MSNQNPTPYDGGPRLLDRVRDALRQRHYSYRTEQAYIHWIKRYIFFHGKKHPAHLAKLRLTVVKVQKAFSTVVRVRCLLHK